MIGVLTYMMIGAVLMLLTFKTSKLRDILPTWYANYTVAQLAQGREFVDRERFDKVVFVMIFLMFLFVWPGCVFVAIKKAFKDVSK